MAYPYLTREIRRRQIVPIRDGLAAPLGVSGLAVSPATGFDRGARQRVGALVFGMAGMAPDPAPRDAVADERGFEPLPQIPVPHRFLVGRLPAALLPGFEPQRDAVMEIAAVGVNHGAHAALQVLERGDRRHHFHAVVGGLLLEAG